MYRIVVVREIVCAQVEEDEVDGNGDGDIPLEMKADPLPRK